MAQGGITELDIPMLGVPAVRLVIVIDTMIGGGITRNGVAQFAADIRAQAQAAAPGAAVHLAVLERG